MISRSAALLCALLLGACSQTNTSDSLVTGSGPGSNDQAKAELPQCTQPLGTVALVEKQISALDDLGLPTPLPLLNSMISQSGCFQIVDPAAAKLAHSRGGKHKAPTPDYLLSADILAQNPNAGSFDTGAVSSFIPGFGGSLAGSLSVKTSEVKTALYLSDTKTGLQLTSATGQAQTTDVGANVARFARTDVRIAAYSDTPIGKTASAAFLDAYIKLVKYVQANPKAAPKIAKR
jgi:hypothetical protein